MSWIEACSAYARAGVPMRVGDVRDLLQRRAHDGTPRYSRPGVFQSIEAAKAKAVEEAIDQ